MNRVSSALRTAARATGSAIAWMGGKAAEHLALVPVYLQRLLWLISQKFRDLTDQGFRGNAAVYACLRFLANSVAEPPLVAYARRPDGEPGEPLRWDHPLREIIRRPNPFLTEFGLWRLVALQSGIIGRSVWWKERDNLGRIVNLWPLRPDRIGPIYAGPDDAQPVILGWSYQMPGTSRYIPIPIGDTVQFVFPDPIGESGGLVEGLGPLQVLAMEVGADNEATRYVGNLLHNDARPGTVLKVKGKITSKEDALLLKEAFRSEYGGNRRGLPGVVDEETDVVALGFNLKDLEFPALREVSESRIAAAFSTPAILVGLLVGLKQGIRATIAEQRELFVEQTLSVYWRCFADQINLDLAPEYGAGIVCAFDVAKVKALATQNAVKVNQTRDAADRGVVTINEYRAALNLAPRDDGDVYVRGIAPGRGMETFAPAAPEYGIDQPGDDLPDSAKANGTSPNGKVVDASNSSLVAAA